jgi:large subunit ribosomal protein L3
MKGILGKKIGMTQIFENGKLVPVTVIEAGPCFVLQKKTAEKEGYVAIQVGFDGKSEKNINKPMAGIFKKANVKPLSFLREFKVDAVDGFELGQEFKVDVLNGVEYVDVTGTTKGKGFQGVMKRYGFDGGPRSHGASLFHRAPGGIGQSTWPGKVMKGKKMPGRMGNDKVTVQNLKVVKVDAENNLLLVKGAVPGAKNSYLVINPAVKIEAAK